MNIRQLTPKKVFKNYSLKCTFVYKCDNSCKLSPFKRYQNKLNLHFLRYKRLNYWNYFFFSFSQKSLTKLTTPPVNETQFQFFSVLLGLRAFRCFMQFLVCSQRLLLNHGLATQGEIFPLASHIAQSGTVGTTACRVKVLPVGTASSKFK